MRLWLPAHVDTHHEEDLLGTPHFVTPSSAAPSLAAASRRARVVLAAHSPCGPGWATLESLVEHTLAGRGGGGGRGCLPDPGATASRPPCPLTHLHHHHHYSMHLVAVTMKLASIREARLPLNREGRAWRVSTVAHDST